jgi:uncharacterized protein YndB with AHSA1/START domain
MDKVQFVYETYISTTRELLWDALIDPKMTAKYWERENVSDWHPGSRWEHRNLDKSIVSIWLERSWNFHRQAVSS